LAPLDEFVQVGIDNWIASNVEGLIPNILEILDLPDPTPAPTEEPVAEVTEEPEVETTPEVEMTPEAEMTPEVEMTPEATPEVDG
jgi:hypothetical protein